MAEPGSSPSLRARPAPAPPVKVPALRIDGVKGAFAFMGSKIGLTMRGVVDAAPPDPIMIKPTDTLPAPPIGAIAISPPTSGASLAQIQSQSQFAAFASMQDLGRRSPSPEPGAAVDGLALGLAERARKPSFSGSAAGSRRPSQQGQALAPASAQAQAADAGGGLLPRSLSAFGGVFSSISAVVVGSSSSSSSAPQQAGLPRSQSLDPSAFSPHTPLSHANVSRQLSDWQRSVAHDAVPVMRCFALFAIVS